MLPRPATGPAPRPLRRAGLVHGALRAAARRGTVVEKEILGLGEVVGPGDVCLDVGAEYGLYTHVLADLVGRDGTVHAFEPQLGAHRLLRAGILAAGLRRRVHLHRTALGATDGEAVLSVPRRRGMPVHGRAFVTAGALDEGPNREFAGRRHERVLLTTLDATVARLGVARVAFLKADVEGAEMALLDGAATTFSTHRPHLLLEVEERHSAKYGVSAVQVFDRMTREHGYTARVWSDGWQRVGSVSETERNYLFSP